MEENTRFRRVPITHNLCVYIQRANYEAKQFSALLQVVTGSERFKSRMTPEEYESSLSYFREKCREANELLRAVMESVREIYTAEIGTALFDVDFVDDAIVIAPPDARACWLAEHIQNHQLARHRSRGYGDELAGMYSEVENISMKTGGNHCMNITFQVTDACNMACSYCYQHNKGSHRMSFETAKEFIDMFLAADERTTNYLNANEMLGVIFDFIGGEPFLEIELIDQICEYFIAELFRRKHRLATRFMFCFSSNGLLYFEPKVQEYLARYNGLVSVSITVDGSKELHDACRVDLDGNGTYDRAMAAARDVMRRYRQKGTKMTIAPGNVAYLRGAVAAMLENGYRHINLNCVYEKGWTREHAGTLYEQLIQIIDDLAQRGLLDEVYLSILEPTHCRPMDEADNRNWCGGTGLMLAIDHQGLLYPCQRYTETSLGSDVEPYVIGDLEHGLCNTEQHKKRVQCMECITRRSQSTDECFRCPIARGCSWCSAYNYECFGTPDKRATYICDMHKARSLAIAYYLARRDGKAAIYCPEDWAVEIIGQEAFDRLKEICAGTIKQLPKEVCDHVYSRFGKVQ